MRNNSAQKKINSSTRKKVETEKAKSRIFKQINAGDFIQAAYRGILERDPDFEGLEAYKKVFASGDFAVILADMVSSVEFRERMLTALTPDIVKGVYRSLLGREPEPEGLAAYSAQLAGPAGISGILEDISASEEFKRRQFAGMAPELIKDAYRGLLNREADEEGLVSSIARLAHGEKLELVLADIVKSDEFRNHFQSNLAGTPETGGGTAGEEYSTDTVFDVDTVMARLRWKISRRSNGTELDISTIMERIKEEAGRK